MSLATVAMFFRLAVAWIVDLVLSVLKLRRGFLQLDGSSVPAAKAADGSPLKVAVIGGGIAGTSAAWHLRRYSDRLQETLRKDTSSSAIAAPVEITILESRHELGGNAKTFSWDLVGTPGVKSPAPAPTVRTGLSVLGWPPVLFRYYEALLRVLRVPVAPVKPKFFVTEDEKEISFAHRDPTQTVPASSCNAKWAQDMRRWDRGIWCIQTVSLWCLAPWRQKVASLVTLLRYIITTLRTAAFGKRHLDAADAAYEAKLDEKKKQEVDAQWSLYTMALWNPLNYMTGRFIMTKVFRVSNEFWDVVVVGVYSSSFLTANLNDLPATILPSLDIIISVGAERPLRELHTWSAAASSKTVFDRMAQDIISTGAASSASTAAVEGPAAAAPKNTILLSTAIKKVIFMDGAGGRAHKVCIEYEDAVEVHDAASGSGKHRSTSNELRTLWVDTVIFACPATAVAEMVEDRTSARNIRGQFFNALIGGVRYESQRDDSFTTGILHTQRAGCLPSPLQDVFLQQRYSNYVRVDRQSAKVAPTAGATVVPSNVTNVFVLGTWVPSAVEAASQHGGLNTAPASRGAGAHLDMYVSYNDPHAPSTKSSVVKGTVDNTWGHPVLSHTSLLQSFALRLLQGKGEAYYCGNFTTPGNGHDLSLISGANVARSLVRTHFGKALPAYYFDAMDREVLVCEQATVVKDAYRDVAQLRFLMGL